MLGDVGYSWQSLWLDRFASKYDVSQEFVAAGENKVKFNPFEPIKPESEEWMKAHLARMQSHLKQGLSDIRPKLAQDEALLSGGLLDAD